MSINAVLAEVHFKSSYITFSSVLEIGFCDLHRQSSCLRTTLRDWLAVSREWKQLRAREPPELTSGVEFQLPLGRDSS
jgi:hypothetical protein